MTKTSRPDAIDAFIAPVKTTEREIFGELLRDCTRGYSAIKKTNAKPTKDNIDKETVILKEIICG